MARRTFDGNKVFNIIQDEEVQRAHTHRVTSTITQRIGTHIGQIMRDRQVDTIKVIN